MQHIQVNAELELRSTKWNHIIIFNDSFDRENFSIYLYHHRNAIFTIFLAILLYLRYGQWCN